MTSPAAGKSGHVIIEAYSDETASLVCAECRHEFMADGYGQTDNQQLPIMQLVVNLGMHRMECAQKQREGKEMARPITCDMEDQELAALVITNPENGEVNGFCVMHFCGFAVAFLEQFAPEMLAPKKPPARGKSRKTAAAAVADDSQGGDSVATGAPAESRPA